MRQSIQKITTLGVLLAIILSVASFAKIPKIVQLHVAGLYGRVHEWMGIDIEAHKVALKIPNNAPIITSDYHSNVGANGYRRTGKHRGVDMFAETGSPVIAAADGKVIKAKTDRCWGPTILIRHGKDKSGERLYALYGHVRNINVKVGQRVKRGQQIAEMGEDIFTKCGGGLHHLHFQLSYSSTQIPLGWGWANFVSDGATAPNPHKFWENGEGKITCFEEGKRYSTSGLTYPLPCFNKPKQQRERRTILAKNNNTSRNLPSPVVLNRPRIKTLPRVLNRPNAPLPAVVTSRPRPQALPPRVLNRPNAPLPAVVTNRPRVQALPRVLNRPNAPLPAVVANRPRVQTLPRVLNRPKIQPLPDAYEELSLAEFLPRYSLSHEVKRQRPLPEATINQATLDGEFIVSGVRHHSMTTIESMALFSSMSDWPE